MRTAPCWPWAPPSAPRAAGRHRQRLQHHRTTAATAGLNARQDVNGAHGPISGGNVVATIPNKSTVYIDCYWYDSGVTGPWGTTRVWDAIEGYRTPNGTHHDLSGYTGEIFVSDAWVDTGGDTSKLVTPCYGY
jgi:hypothetical protein